MYYRYQVDNPQTTGTQFDTEEELSGYLSCRIQPNTSYCMAQKEPWFMIFITSQYLQYYTLGIYTAQLVVLIAKY